MSFLVIQLGRIYLDMLNVYKVMSENISAAIALNGESVTKQPLIKSMRVVKKETLKLISGWVSRSDDHSLVLENFIPPLLEAVLLDYQVIISFLFFVYVFLCNYSHCIHNCVYTYGIMYS